MLLEVRQKSKNIHTIPPLQGNSVQTLTIEAALSTPTNEEIELSSSPADQASGSTQTEVNALDQCSARWRKLRIT